MVWEKMLGDTECYLREGLRHFSQLQKAKSMYMNI